MASNYVKKANKNNKIFVIHRIDKDTSGIVMFAKNENISYEEAKQVLEMDKRIDRGEKLFELPPELEAGARKARRADRKKVENVKRERKPDEDKRELIQYLESSLEDAYPDLDLGNITITNPEREMEFTYNGIKYRLTLMRPRK